MRLGDLRRLGHEAQSPSTVGITKLFSPSICFEHETQETAQMGSGLVEPQWPAMVVVAVYMQRS
jgi:hypothetical protein